MSKYARLTLSRRLVLENMSTGGHTQADIGLAIGAGQSTVSREPRRLDRCAELASHLSHFMKAKCSIAQALALTARKYPRLARITAQAVYDWLYSSDTPIKKALRKLMVRPRSRLPLQDQDDHHHLPHRRKTPTTPNPHDLARSQEIKDMVPIGERPAGARDRSEFGHWEGDLIIGKNGATAAATMVERVTRITVIIKVSTRKSRDVITALAARNERKHQRRAAPPPAKRNQPRPPSRETAIHPRPTQQPAHARTIRSDPERGLRGQDRDYAIGT